MNDENDRSENRDLIYGKNAVLAFLESQTTGEKRSGGSIHKILMAVEARPDVRLEKIRRLARQSGIPLISVDRRKLDKMVSFLPETEKKHQGVVAQINQISPLELDELLHLLDQERQRLAQGESPPRNELLIILDGIEDPHNLGAIMRVAEAAGARALILPVRRSAGVTASVAKSSAGASAILPVVNVQNLVRAIERLKEANFWIVGMSGDAKQSFFQGDLKRPLAVVIGNEGHGLTRLVSEHCDFRLRIPMLGQTASLNASVAAGIILYEFVRQNSS
jgi:23S rRNA (guanosine2251-2'-O)-methyltransferase